MRPSLFLACILLTAATVARATAADDGEALYRQHCAICHEGGVARAADRHSLARTSASNMLATLDTGAMRAQGATLSSAQRTSLVSYLTSTDASAPSEASEERPPAIRAACQAGTPAFAIRPGEPHWTGWGGSPAQRRYQNASMARLTADQVPKLRLKWAFGFAGAARASSQPAIVGGRVFVGGADRHVYSLDARSGCTHWTFDAEAGIRSAISVGTVGNTSAVFFGDQRANAYALNATTGELLWKTRVEESGVAMITGAPVLAEGVLYVPTASQEESFSAMPAYECCKTRGTVSALDALSGKVLWKAYTIGDTPHPTRTTKKGSQLWGPSGAGVWSAPTIDLKANRVYVTTGNSYSEPVATTSDAFLAFDLKTGKMLWSRQMTANDAYVVDCDFPEARRNKCPSVPGEDFDFASSASLVTLADGHRILVAGQKSGFVHAIDPDRDGAILWQRKVASGGRSGGVQWGTAVDAENAYVAVSDVRQTVATGKEAGAEQSIFRVPMKLDSKAGGGLYALQLATGNIVWHTPHPGCGDKPGCSPAQSAAVTVIDGVVFSGGLDGHLRAYSTATGKILWDVDTRLDYATVNGVEANGGSLDGPGPVIVDGMLYVNSGYSYLGSAPGNVLLAFSVDGK
jgi:polyvinyl alcohol dehydrogenase (cytochrome)